MEAGCGVAVEPPPEEADDPEDEEEADEGDAGAEGVGVGVTVPPPDTGVAPEVAENRPRGIGVVDSDRGRKAFRSLSAPSFLLSSLPLPGLAAVTVGSCSAVEPPEEWELEGAWVVGR